MEEFGGFIAEQLIKAVREANKKSDSPQAAKARAAAEAEAARQRAIRAKAGAPGIVTPRRAPNLSPQPQPPGARPPSPPPGGPRGARPAPVPRAPVPPAPAQRPAAPRAAPAPLAPTPPPPLTLDDGVDGFEPIEALSIAFGEPAAAVAPRANAAPRAGLLSAFGEPGSLIAAIVLGEALALPISLRPGGSHREER